MPLTDTIIRGPVGVEDRTSTFHPEDWRRKIKMIEMRNAPMLTIMQSMGSEPVTDYRYHWAVQPFATMRGTVTDVFTDSALADAYTSGVDGTVVYLQMSVADAQQIVPTDVLTVMRTDTKTQARVYVQSVSIAGATNTYVQGILIGTDAVTLALAGTTLYFTITGNAQAEYSVLPNSIFREPIWFDNYTQQFMGSWDLSNREKKVAERVDPKVRERAKMQAYKEFLRKKELAYRFGVKASKTGPNNKPITFTDGIVTAIENMVTLGYDAANVWNYVTDTNYSGQTFNQGGLQFIEEIGEEISRFGESPNKTVYGSSLAVMHINRAIRDNSYYNITSSTTDFGINVHRLTLPGAQPWTIIEDPIFSENPAYQDCLLVTEKQLLKEKVFQPMKEISGETEQNDGHLYISGEKGGWECDTGLMYENLDAFAWITGIGSTNTA